MGVKRSLGFTSYLSRIFRVSLVTGNYFSDRFDILNLNLSDSFVSLVKKLPWSVFTYLSRSL